MAIQLLQEKAVIANARSFSRNLKALLPGQSDARKRHKLLKAYVRSITGGIEYLQKLQDPSQYDLLLRHFAESFLPNQQKVIQLIGNGLDTRLLGKTLAELQGFFNQELSDKPNAIELYNAMALALQIEVVRASRELRNEEDDPQFIRQGQQVETETDADDAADPEEDKRYLEEDFHLAEENLDLSGEHIRQFAHVIEHLSARQRQSDKADSTNLEKHPPEEKPKEDKHPGHTPKMAVVKDGFFER